VSPPYETTVEVSPSPALQHFRETSYVALERYRPRYYAGKISFVRAAIPTDFPANPAAVWSHLAREFEVTTVPGDHLGMMTTHFESLARTISDVIRATRE
jgi:thioesterase domain-containing protein